MEFRRKVPPFLAKRRMSSFSRKVNMWQPMKEASFSPMKYGAWIGSGPKRRWEVVVEPDFLESYSK